MLRYLISGTSCAGIVAVIMFFAGCSSHAQRTEVELGSVQLGMPEPYSQEGLDRLLLGEIKDLSDANILDADGELCCTLIGNQAQAIVVAISAFNERFPNKIGHYSVSLFVDAEAVEVMFLARYMVERQRNLDGVWMPENLNGERPSYSISVDIRSLSILDFSRTVE